VKYGLITIDAASGDYRNFGNKLIVWSLLRELNLPDPYVTVSMFSNLSDFYIDELNKCDFVIIPGSTVFAKDKNNSNAMLFLDRIRVNKICFCASGWAPYYEYNIDAIKNVTPPVGCRDPETLSICNSLGIPAVLVGCPTMYIPTFSKPYEHGFDVDNVFGFCRNKKSYQVDFFKKICGSSVAAIQELSDRKVADASGISSFTYNIPDVVMCFLSRCCNVYSGRLHSILPAISQNKNFMFFGDDRDSRFSLLSYIGVTIHRISDNMLPVLQNCSTVYERVQELYYNFTNFSKVYGIK
jgi:hypothetical protein